MLFASLFLCVLVAYPQKVHANPNDDVVTIKPMDYEEQISDLGAGFFIDKYEGIYVCRPQEPINYNVYHISVDAKNILNNYPGQFDSFYPQYVALVCKDGSWEEIGNGNSASFWIEPEDPGNKSIACFLRESAPAALYGVRCKYKLSDDNWHYEDFKILYTDVNDWTYINVSSEKNNRTYDISKDARRVYNFTGGTLELKITFNDGAADPSLAEIAGKHTDSSSHLPYGAIKSSSSIVSVNKGTMDVTIKTLSGKTYPMQKLDCEFDRSSKNRIKLQFNEKLGNDVYLIQISSRANNQIIGQFIIDNSNMKAGVNLSQLWILVMILGGLLSLGAASAYFVPLIIVKVNEFRVNREIERVDRMKNPDKYTNKEKKTFKQRIDKVIYNLKTPAYKRKKDEEKEQEEIQTEEKQHTNRFDEMLRERHEKRDFMQEHNVTSEEMERMKEKEAAAAADEVNSFAVLRDDDDEEDDIATFHAAKDDISTLETGAYVEGGTTFAKLDSMRDEKSQKVENSNETINNNPENPTVDSGNQNQNDIESQDNNGNNHYDGSGNEN